MNKPKSTKELTRENDDLFHGMGNIKEPKTGKAIKVGFEIEAGIQPIAQKPKHVPYHQESPLKNGLNREKRIVFSRKCPEIKP